MPKRLLAFTLLCAGLSSYASANTPDKDATAVNPVIEWNRTLLQIVRTPGAQPPTIHSTRNFAILHIAIFEAVNNIDRNFKPYAVRLPHVSHNASPQAATDQPSAVGFTEVARSSCFELDRGSASVS